MSEDAHAVGGDQAGQVLCVLTETYSAGRHAIVLGLAALTLAEKDKFVELWRKVRVEVKPFQWKGPS